MGREGEENADMLRYKYVDMEKCWKEREERDFDMSRYGDGEKWQYLEISM